MEGEQPKMDMNRIDAPGSTGTPPPIEPQRAAGQAAASRKKPKRPADRIELSDEARQLMNGAESPKLSREQKLEEARQRLLSGELFKPEVYESAAEKLLRSGDLEKPEAE